VIWQDLLIELLEQEPNLRTVDVASDGPTGVQKAKELQPDLVLLDLNLAELNGIDVAQQIRILSPTSKILFVSVEGDPDIQRAALRAGGSGYILKKDVASDLMPAIGAVLNGKKFISPQIADCED
jgi:DNA-binding NarL/FixJ family response regulator